MPTTIHLTPTQVLSLPQLPKSDQISEFIFILVSPRTLQYFVCIYKNNFFFFLKIQHFGVILFLMICLDLNQAMILFCIYLLSLFIVFCFDLGNLNMFIAGELPTPTLPALWNHFSFFSSFLLLPLHFTFLHFPSVIFIYNFFFANQFYSISHNLLPFQKCCSCSPVNICMCRKQSKILFFYN